MIQARKHMYSDPEIQLVSIMIIIYAFELSACSHADDYPNKRIIILDPMTTPVEQTGE